MRKTFLTLVLCFTLLLGAYAQTGIYLTFDDFKNGKLMKAEGDDLRIKTAKRELTIKYNGEKKTYPCDSVYGVLLDGSLYRLQRIAMATVPCKLFEVNDNYAMWKYSETTKYYDGHPDSKHANYYLSNKLDGKLVYVNLFAKVDAIENEKGFKPLVDCIKSGKKGLLIVTSGKCIADDPTYKKNPEDAIPPIK